MDGTIGEIRLFAGNFAPKQWLYCQGQLLAISQYSALFSILGTTYGGNGTVTFALPDLRGRVPVGTGQRSGVTVISGEQFGTETNVLTMNHLPDHGHSANGTFALPAKAGKGAYSSNPASNIYGKPADTMKMYSTAAKDTTMGAGVTTIAAAPAGQSAPVNNMMPYSGLNYIICINGLYPVRP